MKFTIHDVRVVARTVEVPDQCPHCGEQIVNDKPGKDAKLATRVFEYAVQSRALALFQNGETEAGSSEAGEGSYELMLWCQACDNQIVAGEEVYIPEGDNDGC